LRNGTCGVRVGDCLEVQALSLNVSIPERLDRIAYEYRQEEDYDRVDDNPGQNDVSGDLEARCMKNLEVEED
jgi:hypothetical protein